MKLPQLLIINYFYLFLFINYKMNIILTYYEIFYNSAFTILHYLTLLDFNPVPEHQYRADNKFPSFPEDCHDHHAR